MAKLGIGNSFATDFFLPDTSDSNRTLLSSDGIDALSPQADMVVSQKPTTRISHSPIGDRSNTPLSLFGYSPWEPQTNISPSSSSWDSFPKRSLFPDVHSGPNNTNTTVNPSQTSSSPTTPHHMNNLFGSMHPFAIGSFPKPSNDDSTFPTWTSVPQHTKSTNDTLRAPMSQNFLSGHSPHSAPSSLKTGKSPRSTLDIANRDDDLNFLMDGYDTTYPNDVSDVGIAHSPNYRGSDPNFGSTTNTDYGAYSTSDPSVYSGERSTGDLGFPSPSGEHPMGEHPSRTLFVRNINSNVEDEELSQLFEQYGPIRSMYTQCKHRGFVMISYYDIRHAKNAMRYLQGKVLRRRKLDIHYSIPKDNPSEKDQNQGTLVVFNLDPSTSNDDLKQIFGQFGEIKEIRETPNKKHHKFIEFYDIRDAERAMKHLNKSEIKGKKIKIEPSRPGGARKTLLSHIPASDAFNGNGSNNTPPNASILTSNQSHSLPNHYLYSGEDDVTLSFGTSSSSSHPSNGNNHNPVLSTAHSMPTHTTQNHIWSSPFDSTTDATSYSAAFSPSSSSTSNYGSSNFSGKSFYNGMNGISPTGSLQMQMASVSISASPPSTAFRTGNTMSNASPSNSVIRPRSASFTTGITQASATVTNNSHVAPSSSLNNGIVKSTSGTSLASAWLPPASNSINGNNADGNSSPRNFSPIHFDSVTSNPAVRKVGISMSPPNTLDTLMHIPIGSIGERSPSPSHSAKPDFPIEPRRLRSHSIEEDKSKYVLLVEKVRVAEDKRTTLMIKNIPNKYTQKMLLANIDEKHKGNYDFFYLPIDFKNKCNVGYAFINFVATEHIIPFYEDFNNKKWEKFNSDKVCEITYARIQGQSALIAHFQNSSLLCEDKKCRPMIFHDGEPENFPVGLSPRNRSRSSSFSGIREEDKP